MGSDLSLRRLNRATLLRQGLLERFDGSVAEVVGRLAGLQAQHANSPYVALWSRRTDTRITDLEEALTDRSVVKATLMRATLHIVASSDFPALDVTSAEGPLGSWAPTARRAGVELDEVNARLLEYCREPRTVAEISEHLRDTVPAARNAPPGVRNVGFRLASAAGGLVHVPPSGMWKSHGKPSYLAASLWLGDSDRPELDDAAVVAVERYLTSHGPASVDDIKKWAGIRKISVLRRAVAALDGRLIEYSGPDGRPLIDLDGATVPAEDVPAPPRFLSRWDSVLIAYDVRDRILPDEYKEAVIKKNGDFLPTFLVDGFVAGLWKTESTKGDAVLTMNPFGPVPAAARAGLEEQAERLVRYVEPDAAAHHVVWGG